MFADVSLGEIGDEKGGVGKLPGGGTDGASSGIASVGVYVAYFKRLSFLGDAFGNFADDDKVGADRPPGVLSYGFTIAVGVAADAYDRGEAFSERFHHTLVGALEEFGFSFAGFSGEGFVFDFGKK